MLDSVVVCPVLKCVANRRLRDSLYSQSLRRVSSDQVDMATELSSRACQMDLGVRLQLSDSVEPASADK